MTALGKLLRTTAFKLTLVYLTIFAVFAAFLLGYFTWNTRRLITEQITQTVDAEITGLAPLPGDDAGRRGACRQRGIAGDRHSRNSRLDRNGLPSTRRSRRRPASRLG